MKRRVSGAGRRSRRWASQSDKFCRFDGEGLSRGAARSPERWGCWSWRRAVSCTKGRDAELAGPVSRSGAFRLGEGREYLGLDGVLTGVFGGEDGAGGTALPRRAAGAVVGAAFSRDRGERSEARCACGSGGENPASRGAWRTLCTRRRGWRERAAGQQSFGAGPRVRAWRPGGLRMVHRPVWRSRRCLGSARRSRRQNGEPIGGASIR